MGKEVKKADGDLPSQDKDTFRSMLSSAIKEWQLVADTDIMLANKFVTTFMALQNIEKEIKVHGVYFVSGKNIIMNPMLDYKMKLEQMLMKYHKLLNPKKTKSDKEYVEDFSTFLLGNKKKKK